LVVKASLAPATADTDEEEADTDEEEVDADECAAGDDSEEEEEDPDADESEEEEEEEEEAAVLSPRQLRQVGFRAKFEYPHEHIQSARAEDCCTLFVLEQDRHWMFLAKLR
jgi:hypothetical protein